MTNTTNTTTTTDPMRSRWAVVCDDERIECATRAEARDLARQMRRHPANADIRRHGPYANVDGVPRVVDTDNDTNAIELDELA